jgi:hypothetical protein
MSRTRLIAASSAALTAVCCLVLLVPAGAPARTARLSATCSPDARVPTVFSGSRTGFGNGYVWCGWPPPTYGYTIRMVNRAGSALITKTGWYGGGSQSWNTPTVSCAGAWVHTFLYINVSGAGKSDTSGDTYC